MRVASQLIQCFDINTNDNENPKSVSKRLTEKIKKNHVRALYVRWIEKPQHGYLMRTRIKDENCDATLTNAWIKKWTFS